MHPLATLALGAALLAGAAPASAQTTYRLGLRGGLNRALTTTDPASNQSATFFAASADKAAIYAGQAGVVFEADFGRLALQPALLFTQKGERLHSVLASRGARFPYNNEQTTANRYNWLELPLNVVYTLRGDHGLQVFAGPYVALAVGGRQTGTSTSYTGFGLGGGGYRDAEVDDRIAYGADTNNRRLDVGVNFGVGYRQGPLQVQLGYGLGLRNLHQPTEIDYDHEFAGDAAYNRVAQLTGTYFFSL